MIPVPYQSSLAVLHHEPGMFRRVFTIVLLSRSQRFLETVTCGHFWAYLPYIFFLALVRFDSAFISSIIILPRKKVWTHLLLEILSFLE